MYTITLQLLQLLLMYTIFLSTLGLKIVVSTRSTGTENRIFKGGAMEIF